MESIALNVDLREETGRQVKNLRKEGNVPGVVYGQGKENVNISVENNIFEKVYRDAGENTVVELSVGGKSKVPVIIYEVKRDPVTSLVQHIDFLRINMSEEIETAIPLNFVGESIAVKNLGGTLVTPKDELQVKCLPNDLIHEFEVDISILNEFSDAIHVSDIKVPGNIQVLHGEEELVAHVMPPRVEVEPTVAETEEGEIVEGEGEEAKAEGEEGAEKTEEAEGEKKEE